jgi:hypothetical protein
MAIFNSYVSLPEGRDKENSIHPCIDLREICGKLDVLS